MKLHECGDVGNSGDNGGDRYTTEDLMHEVFDLMRRRLPKLDASDPGRQRVIALLPALGEALGRDRVVPVPAERERRSASAG